MLVLLCKTLLVMLWSLSALSFAADPVCIRNYKGAGTSACETFPSSYAGVYAVDSRFTPACARIYDPYFCRSAPKEYTEITSVDGNLICVMNFNQPPVANYCESTPQFYTYVERHAP